MYDPEILLASPAFLEKVCAHVEKGASPHVAAQVEGLEEEDYWTFWNAGKQAKTKKEELTEREEFLVRFVKGINLALAKARMDAEKRVFAKNPCAYLRYGSGREGGAEARGWESAIDREKSIFASSPLGYLLKGAGQPGRETRIGWSRGRGGQMIPYVIEEEPSLAETEAFFDRLFGHGAQASPASSECSSEPHHPTPSSFTEKGKSEAEGVRFPALALPRDGREKGMGEDWPEPPPKGHGPAP